MYFDYLLKFDTEADALAALYDQIPTEFDEDGNVTATEPRQKYLAIDTIGVIYKPIGETTVQDGMEVPVLAPIEGWHVNVRHTEPAPELDPYKATPDPATPYRMWA
jgi:hypothetical protein